MRGISTLSPAKFVSEAKARLAVSPIEAFTSPTLKRAARSYTAARHVKPLPPVPSSFGYHGIFFVSCRSNAKKRERYGIRLNAVSPGAVRTEMLIDVFGTEEALDEMGTVHPIGRIGRPEEIADAVA